MTVVANQLNTRNTRPRSNVLPLHFPANQSKSTYYLSAAGNSVTFEVGCYQKVGLRNQLTKETGEASHNV